MKNKLILFTALFMTFLSTLLLWGILQQEGINRKENKELLKNYQESYKEARICQNKMEYLNLLLKQELFTCKH